MKLVAVEGLLKGLEFNLTDKDFFIIGRDESQCDFVLEDSSVSRKHAKIEKKDDEYILINLSETNPLEVNNRPLTNYSLQEGDKIKIGNTIFLFSNDLRNEIEDDFEDNDEENTIYDEPIEELKIPSYEEAPFILKVISGPNAGAEFGLEKNKSYIIGKDPENSDIIFTDLSVSKNNSKLIVNSDGSIILEDLQSKNGTYLNNIQLTKSTKISTDDLITVGTTTFLIVAKEMASETIYSPAPSFEIKEEEKKEEEKVSAEWKKQKLTKKQLIFASSLSVIVFIVFISFFGLFKGHDIEVNVKEPSKEIEKILENFKSIEFSYNPSEGSLLLVGHILTDTKKEELFYELSNLSFINNIDDNIIIDLGIAKTFNENLEDQESFRSVNVLVKEPSKFELAGSVADTKTFQNLVDYINFNFPYVDKLDNKVVIDEILESFVGAKLLEYNLSAITFEIVSQELILAGRYDKKQKSNFDNFISLMEKTNGIRNIKNIAIPSHEQNARIDITQNYKVTGEASINGENISILINGKIVNLGDSIDGFLITKILENTILLEKDELKYKIDYSR